MGVEVGIGVGVLVGGGVPVGAGMAVSVGAGKGFRLGLGEGELQPRRARPTAARATSTTSLMVRIFSSRACRKTRARP